MKTINIMIRKIRDFIIGFRFKKYGHCPQKKFDSIYADGGIITVEFHNGLVWKSTLDNRIRLWDHL